MSTIHTRGSALALMAVLIMMAVVVPTVASAAPSAPAKVFYSNAATAPVFRDYDPATGFGAQTPTGLTGAAQGPVVIKACPTRHEYLAGYVSTGGALYILKWTQAAGWTAEWGPVTVGGTGINGRRFDIAYEFTTGEALVAYSANVATTNEIVYRTMNAAGTWSAATNLNPARTTNIINWIKLKAYNGTGSNKIAMTYSDTSGNLSTHVWSGTAWGNEPASAHFLTTASSLARSATVGDYDSFDQAWESTSGDLLVVWNQSVTTIQQVYRTMSAAGTWGAATSYATARASARIFAESDPQSDQIMTGWNRTASTTSYGRIWSGTAMGTTTTISNADGSTELVGRSEINGAWLVSGGTSVGVLVYSSTSNTTMNYAYYTGTTWTNGQSWPASGIAVQKAWIDADVDPWSGDAMMVTFNDTNNDCWAKQVTWDGATLTWSDADAGTALTATCGAANTYQPFDFEYQRVKPTITVGNGAAVANASPLQSSTNNAVDSFTMVTDFGTGTVTSITVTGNGTTTATNIASAKLYSDAGTLGVYDAGVDTLISSSTITGNSATFGSLSEAVTTSAKNYLVTYDLTATPNNGQTLTGTVSAITTGVNQTLSDSASATLTVWVCTSTGTVTLGSITSPIKTITAITATTGSGAVSPQVRWNNDAATWSSWVASGSDYTPPGPDYAGSVQFEARATDGTCGTYVYDASNPTSKTYSTPTLYTVTSCRRCHANPPLDATGGVRNTPEGAVKGDHGIHASAAGLNLACTECHGDNGSNLAHRNNNIGMSALINGSASSSYTRGTSFPQSNNPTTGTCNNTYCHSNGTSVATGTSPVLSNSPQWGVGTTVCTTCHSKPPAYVSGAPKANSHSVHTTNCSVCHNATTSDGGNTITGPANHGNAAYNVIANSSQFASYTFNIAGGTCNTVCCHGDASPQWGGTQTCLDCHTGSVCSPNAAALDPTVTTRRSVVGEFGMTWSHKRTAGGTVTNNDCGVCHMEGTAATGAKNATYHGNGYVELRDPDLGTTIKTVTFAGTPGSYTSTGTDALFVRFSRDLSSNILESAVTAIQINQCIKCHDAVGAASALARVPSGTALRPFNTAPTHTPGNNVLNVAAHFATSNSSYHPVLGKQNNSYADVNLMWPPFNQTARTAGSITQWGDLISCWDCHAPDGTASTVTLTSTVTAHGGMTTLRGASTVSGTPSVSNAATLCMLCHDTTTYNQATPGHGPNSAASNLNRTQKIPFLQYGCNVCHSSGYNTAATRPTRSEDVHGTNTLPTIGQTLSGRWLATGTPIAFIRNRSYLGNHEPLNVGGTGYTPGCNMLGTDGGTVCSNQGLKTYTVGGNY